jgi:hypothetical protein
MTTWTVEAESASQTVGLGAAASAAAAADSATAAASSATAAATSVTAAGLNVRVAPYSATGDGTTNDTVAIQAAIDATPDGGRLRIPAGNYRVNELTIAKNIWIEGDGSNSTHIRRVLVTTGGALFKVTNAGGQLAITDLELNGQGRADYCVKFEDWAGVGSPYLKSLYMTRCKLYDGVVNNVYLGNRRFLAFCSDTEFYGGATPVRLYNGGDHRFVNCDFGAGTGDGCKVEGQLATVFTGCFFYGNDGNGLVLDTTSSRCQVLGGSIDNNDLYGIKLLGKNHAVVGVRFAGNGVTGGATYSDVYALGAYNMMSCCAFAAASPATQNYRVVFDASGVKLKTSGNSVDASLGTPYITAFASNSALLIDSTADGLIVDPSGHVLVGDTTSRAGGEKLQVLTNGAVFNAAGSAQWNFYRANGSVSVPTLVPTGNYIGRQIFYGYDGAAYQTVAAIDVLTDAATGAGDMAGRVSISTTPDGSTTLAERLRVDNKGNVIAPYSSGTISTSATDGFLYVPACSGTPTGAPTAYSGHCPVVVDITNNKLYVYYSSAWKSATLA